MIASNEYYLPTIDGNTKILALQSPAPIFSIFLLFISWLFRPPPTDGIPQRVPNRSFDDIKTEKILSRQIQRPTNLLPFVGTNNGSNFKSEFEQNANNNAVNLDGFDEITGILLGSGDFFFLNFQFSSNSFILFIFFLHL